MPRWVEFTDDYDHRWPSGSVTAFEKGTVVNVKTEVAEAAKAAGAGKFTDKPKAGDPRHESSGRRNETDPEVVVPRLRNRLRTVRTNAQPGNPVTVGGDQKPAEPLPPASDPGALRSEPLVERRLATRLSNQDPPEEIDAASQIDADESGGGDSGDGSGGE